MSKRSLSKEERVGVFALITVFLTVMIEGGALLAVVWVAFWLIVSLT